MAEIDDLIAALGDLNIDDAQPDDEPDWDYNLVFAEVFANPQDAVLVMNAASQFVDLALGDYGKVNVGRGGRCYALVARALQRIRDGQHLPNIVNQVNVRLFLTDGVNDLPAYDGAGPGGQGQRSRDLNTLLVRVRQRLHSLKGALHVQQAIGHPAVRAALGLN